jgi:hypothetical protein
VFLPGAAGSERFWGFAAVTLRLDVLLRAGQVGALDAEG